MKTKFYTENQILTALEKYYTDMIVNPKDYKESVSEPKQDAIDTLEQLKKYINEN